MEIDVIVERLETAEVAAPWHSGSNVSLSLRVPRRGGGALLLSSADPRGAAAKLREAAAAFERMAAARESQP